MAVCRTAYLDDRPASGNDWKSILSEYDDRFRADHTDGLAWFAGQRSFESAIDYAGRAVQCNGKRFDHQRRIRKEAIPLALHALLRHQALLARTESFAHLLGSVRDIVLPIYGVGELYCYDTSLRIGAFLGRLPSKVYLHAGALKGARKLYPNRTPLSELRVGELPPLLRSRPPHEIENILCIFKEQLVVEATQCESPPNSLLQLTSRRLVARG